jgi:hypothetical protein
MFSNRFHFRRGMQYLFEINQTAWKTEERGQKNKYDLPIMPAFLKSMKTMNSNVRLNSHGSDYEE